MIDELRTFVTLIEAGSLQRAADRLFMTPSAVSRQVQRLELSLGTEIVDRRVKPLGITPIGQTVLDQARGILRSYETLKSVASQRSAPSGVFRIGFAHGLAVGSLAGPIRRMTEHYPALFPRISADATQALLTRVRRGDLDAAVMLLPAREPHWSELASSIIATDCMCLAGPDHLDLEHETRSGSLDTARWVVNPPGCFIREQFKAALTAAGSRLTIAAEVHNLDLQFSLVGSDYGYGLFPATYLRRRSGQGVSPLRLAFDFRLPIEICLVRGADLGHLAPAINCLEEALSEYFRAEQH